MEADLKKLLVRELRAKCKTAKLDSTGRKAQLVARLVAHAETKSGTCECFSFRFSPDCAGRCRHVQHVVHVEFVTLEAWPGRVARVGGKSLREAGSVHVRVCVFAP